MTQNKSSTPADVALPVNDNVNDSVIATSPRKGGKKTKFDYQALPEKDRKEVENIVLKIRQALARQLNGAVEAGVDLLKVKDLVGHGNFRAWLRREFSWSERTASNYMELARNSEGKTAKFADLDLGAAKALIAKTTPVEIRNELLRRAEDGENITREEVRQRIADGRAAERKAGPHEKKANLSNAKKVEVETVRALATADDPHRPPDTDKSPAGEVSDALLNLLHALEKKGSQCEPDDVAELLLDGESKRLPLQVNECADFIKDVFTGLEVLMAPEPEVASELDLAS